MPLRPTRPTLAPVGMVAVASSKKRRPQASSVSSLISSMGRASGPKPGPGASRGCRRHEPFPTLLGGWRRGFYKPAPPNAITKRSDFLPRAERPFSIIKPDATRRNLTGKVNAVIEDAGLRIVAQRRIKMSRAQAEKFYEIHKERPFFGELVDFMISEPVVVQVLEGDNAVARYREGMGATNPANADEGTIRKLYAVSVGENSVHGSDSQDNAALEIAQFFTDAD